MANFVTTGRLFLLFVLVCLVYQAPPAWQVINAPFVLFIFALDGVDGWVARRRGEQSLFGSIFDIAVDRVVENVLWVVLAHQGLVPIWVPLVFLTRGFLVDSLRSQGTARGEAPFAMMRTRLGRFLVAGRTLRASYATVKATAFAWLLMYQPWPAIAPELWARWQGPVTATGAVLVYAAVVLCLARGLPVIVEVARGEVLRARPRRADARREREAGWRWS